MTEPAPNGSPDPPAVELELEFPPKAEFVRSVRHTVTALARLHDLPDDVCENVRLAVSEACTTSIVSDGDPHRLVRIQAWKEDGRFVVDLIDSGSNVARAVAGPPSEIDTGDLPFESALSLPIVRGLVDEVAIVPLDGAVRLRMAVSIGE